jgi:hypothetical protein
LARKRGKLVPKRRLFKTILTSVIKTRSLDNFFIFKESEKILTMDSIRNVLLDYFNECERIRSLGDIFNFRESKKSLTMESVKVVLLGHFNEYEEIRSLDDLFNFRDFEKSLTMDTVGVPFFVNLVPQARKRVKIIPKDTLLGK